MSTSNRRSFFGFGKDKDKDKTSGKAVDDKIARTTSRLSIQGGAVSQNVGAAASSTGRQSGQISRQQYEEQQRQYAARQQQQQGRPAGRSDASTASPPLKGPLPASGLVQGPTPAARSKELEFAIDLIGLQNQKIYATSPPTMKSMVSAEANGKHPRAGPPGTPGNDWQEVWCELRGIVLHVWNMQEVAEANARGEDKHPDRTNVTDAFVDLIQPLPPTRHNPQAGPHPFVFSLNTAGLNSILFSCTTKAEMEAWVTATRLAAWESSRLMEIYTGHLLRASGVPPPPLVNNRLAGWFDVRTFASRSWMHLWVVLSVNPPAGRPGSPDTNQQNQPATSKTKNRISKLFHSSSNSHEINPYPPIPGESSPTVGDNRRRSTSSASELGNIPTVSAQFYRQPPKPAGSRSSASAPGADLPFLTVTDVSQAFAVFPEVETEIENSAMFKLEAHLSGEGVGGAASRRDEGWVLMIPMEKNADSDVLVAGKRADMLKWLVGFHDAFHLYGRPGKYSWDARDPKSLLFAHPHGPRAPELFLTDPVPNPSEMSISRASFVRGRFREQLVTRLQTPQSQVPPSRTSQSMLAEVTETPEPVADRDLAAGGASALAASSQQVAHSSDLFKLPPLVFGGEQQEQQQGNAPLPAQGQLPQTQYPAAAASDAKHPLPLPVAQQQQQQPQYHDSLSRGSGSQRSLPGPSGTRANGSLTPQQPSSNAPIDLLASPTSYTLPTSYDRQPQGFATEPNRQVTAVPQGSGTHVPGPDGSYPPVTLASFVTNPNSASLYSQPSGPASRSNTASNSQSNDHTGALAYLDAAEPLARPAMAAASVGGTRYFTPPVESSEAGGFSYPAAGSSTSPQPQPQASGSSSSAGSWSPTPQAQNSSQAMPVPSAGSRMAEGTSSLGSQGGLDALASPMSRTDGSSSMSERTTSFHRDTPGMASLHSLGPAASTSPPASAADHTSPSSVLSHTSSTRREHLGRRPSGARAAPGRRIISIDGQPPAGMAAVQDESGPNSPIVSEPPVVDRTSVYEDARSQMPSRYEAAPAPHQSAVDQYGNEDALAALSFLEATGGSSPVKTRALPLHPPQASSDPRENLPPIQTSFPAPGSATPALAPVSTDAYVASPASRTASESSPAPASFPSSFGPSKSAAERRAKAEAAQQQRQAVLTKPGKKSAGAAKAKAPSKGWAASSEEDEDEEEDEDDEGSVNSHGKPALFGVNSPADDPASSRSSLGPGSGSRPLPQNPGSQPQQQRIPSRPTSAASNRQASNRQRQQQLYYEQPPPLPNHPDLLPPRASFAGNGNRDSSPRQSSYSGYGNGNGSQYGGGEELRQPMARPGALNGGADRGVSRDRSRQSIWNTHLEQPHGGQAAEVPDKFVDLEPASTLTKAFNPNGLLQAGLEDRNDRSAKRQEEIARESGSSLVNVPSKPPPPQSGLLGAITAHERDRARDGGVGAALTERERDRRAAEERARKIDALQREQLEAMGQSGMAGYGQMPYPGMMPSPWGMPGMQMPPPMSMYGGYGGMDPQMAAMFAATQAYQQAMMSYSQAGSQVGPPDDTPQSTFPTQPPMGMPGWGLPPMGSMGMGMGMPMGWGGGSQYGGSPIPGSPSFYGQPQVPYMAGGNGSGSLHGHDQHGGSSSSQNRQGSPGAGNTRSSTPKNQTRSQLGQ